MNNTSVPRLLLCMAPSWGVEMPPISVATLVRALKDQGYNADGRDLNIECYHRLPQNSDYFWNKSNLHYWVNPKLFAEELFPRLDPIMESLSDDLAYGPWDIIGFTVISSNVIFINHLVERIKLKKPEKVIIVGGPCLSFKEERERLRADIDYFIAGEGEESLPELLEYLAGNIQTLPSSIYPSRNCNQDLPFRECKDLTKYGVPDYSIFPLQRYTLDALPLIFTRSCLFKCRFCADHKSMGNFRKLNENQIYQMFSEFYELGYRKFWLNDLLINGIMKELVNVFKRLNSEEKFFEWIALATPNRQLQTEDLMLLKASGLQTLNLGIESGSDSVMRLMRKGFNREQAEQGLKRIFEAGINTQLNIIVGFPGETEDFFNETLEFLDRNKPYICGFTSVNTCVLLPGSEISANPFKFGIEFVEGSDRQTEWMIPGENDQQIRNSRLQRVLEWIETNGYQIYSSNKASTTLPKIAS